MFRINLKHISRMGWGGHLCYADIWHGPVFVAKGFKAQEQWMMSSPAPQTTSVTMITQEVVRQLIRLFSSSFHDFTHSFTPPPPPLFWGKAGRKWDEKECKFVSKESGSLHDDRVYINWKCCFDNMCRLEIIASAAKLLRILWQPQVKRLHRHEKRSHQATKGQMALPLTKRYHHCYVVPNRSVPSKASCSTAKDWSGLFIINVFWSIFWSAALFIQGNHAPTFLVSTNVH